MSHILFDFLLVRGVVDNVTAAVAAPEHIFLVRLSPFPFLLSPPLEVGPLKSSDEVWGALHVSFYSRVSGAEPQKKSMLVQFRHKNNKSGESNFYFTS